MTVIAWDGKTLASDKMADGGGVTRTVTKIFRVGELLCGGAGTLTALLEMKAWLANGKEPSAFPKIQSDNDNNCTFVVIDGGKLLVYERSVEPIHFEDKFYATGSGRDYAIATMALGFDAKRAVEIASQYDPHCGMGMDWLELK